MERNPEKRMGVKNMNEIKEHSFFKDIEFEMILKKEYKTPRIQFESESNDNKNITNVY